MPIGCHPSIYCMDGHNKPKGGRSDGWPDGLFGCRRCRSSGGWLSCKRFLPGFEMLAEELDVTVGVAAWRRESGSRRSGTAAAKAVRSARFFGPLEPRFEGAWKLKEFEPLRRASASCDGSEAPVRTLNLGGQRCPIPDRDRSLVSSLGITRARIFRTFLLRRSR
jgi:hypothetical protein